MAKNKDLVLDDDFELEDMEEFDFDIPDPSIKDDRKPITKVMSGIKEGATSHVKSPAFFKEVFKETFPTSIGRTIDLSDEVTESAKNLYDESVREIKPTLLMARKTISKLVPRDSKVVPKSIQTILEKWRTEDQAEADSAPVSKEAAREAVLDSSLKSIFELQQKSDALKKADQDGRDNLKIGLDQVYHKTQLDAMNRSAMSLRRMEEYSTTVGLNYQKKSLELQFRQLFATQDSIEFMKIDAQRRDQFLASISKNTGLPEFVKSRNSEVRQELHRKKLFDTMNTALFGRTDQMLQEGIAKAKKTVLDNTRNVMQDFRSGMQEASMVGDMATSGMAGDSTVMAGNVAGSVGTQYLGNTAGGWLANKIKGSSFDKKFGVSDKLTGVQTGMDNLPNKLSEFKKDRSGAYDTSIKGMFFNVLRDLMPSMDADKTLSPYTSKDLGAVAKFTNATNRSIVEIIPGFLARIFREIQVFRTGNTKIGLTAFSHDSGSFVDKEVIEKDIDQKVVPAFAKRYTQNSLEDLTQMVDPKKQLDEEQRTALQRRLLRNSADKNEASEKRLAETKEYDSERPEVAKAVAQVMATFLKNLSVDDRALFVKRHNNLADNMADPRQVLQDLLESGNIDELRKGNLIKEEGNGPIKDTKVNIDEIIERYLDKSSPNASSGAPGDRDFIGPTMPRFGQRMANSTRSVASEMADKAKSGLKSLVPDSLTKASTTFADQAKYASGAFSQKVQSYKPRVQEAVGSLKMPTFTPEHKAAVEQAIEVAKQKAQQFSSATSSLITPEHKELIKEATQKAAETYQAAKPAVVEKAADLKDQAKQAAGNMPSLQEVKALIERGIEKAAGGLSSAKDNASATATTLKGQATNLFNQTPGHEKAQSAFDKGKDTLHAMQGAAGEKVSSLWQRVGGQTQDNKAEQDAMASAKANASRGEEVPTVADLYIGNEKEPRIYASKLSQGMYYLKASGKPIFTIAQISGAVMDDHRNQAVSDSEVALLCRYDSRTKSMVKVAPKVMGLGAIVSDLGASMKAGTENLVSSAISAVSTSFSKKAPSDVYVNGEKTPRLLAVKMAQGHYTDAVSGKPIMSPSDIAGEVKDENGQIRINKDDLANLNTYDYSIRKWSPLWIAKKAIQAAWNFETGFAMRWTAWNLKTLGKAMKFVGRTALRMGAGMLGIKMAAPPKDVYVAGESSPRLEGSRFAKGEYIDRETGKVLKNEHEIKGPVTDRNGVTLIDQDDLKNLVSYDTVLQRFSPLRLLKLLALPFKALGWVAKKAFGGAASLGKNYLAKGLPKVAKAGAAVLGGAARLAGRLVGIKKQARAVGAQAQENADNLKNVSAPSTFGKIKDGLFGNKRAAEVLKAPMSAPEAAAVKSSSTLDQILNTIKSMAPGKKTKMSRAEKLAKDKGFLKKDSDPKAPRKGSAQERLKDLAADKDKQKGFAGTLAERLKSRVQKKGADSALLGMLGKLAESIGSLGGFISKIPGAGPAAAVAAAGAAGYYGAKALGADKLGSKLGNIAADIFGPEDVLAKQNEADEKRRKWLKENPGKPYPGDKPKTLAQKATAALPMGSAQAATVPTSSEVAKQNTSLPAAVNAAAPTDAEGKPPNVPSQEAAGKTQSAGNVGTIPQAPGPMASGGGGLAFTALSSGVKLDGLNPELKKNFLAMTEEYGSTTGKKVPVTDGFRSYDDQMRMKVKYGPRAAAPGNSPHEYGLAVDADSKVLNEMEQLGLMRKYGFTRPVGAEPWHVEPIGIQDDINAYKKDPQAASQAIAASPGKGGGGIGMDPSAKPYSRNRANSLAIAKAASEAPKAVAGDKSSITASTSGAIDQASEEKIANAGYAGTARTNRLSNVATGTGANPQPVTAITRDPGSSQGAVGTADMEKKPDLSQVTAVKRPDGAGLSQARNTLSMGPANPGVKIPDPMGPGAQGMRAMIEAAAKLVGTDPASVMQIIAMESGFNPQARAGTSSAAGLGQFTSGTWKEYMGKYASKYGIDPNTPPTDPKASAIMTALMLKDNMQSLGQKTGGQAGVTEAYLGHFLGNGGASKFLTSMKQSPDLPAAQAMGKAAESNRSIFYDGNRPRSYTEIYALLDKRIKDKAQAFGIQAPVSMMAAAPSAAPSYTPGASADVASASATKAPGASATAMPAAPASGMMQASYTPPPKPQPTAVMAAMGGPELPSRQSSTADGYGPGFKPVNPEPNRNVGGMDASLFSKTENLLERQLTVLTDIRDSVKDLIKSGIGGDKQMNASADAPPSEEAKSKVVKANSAAESAYQVPRAIISMKRRIA